LGGAGIAWIRRITIEKEEVRGKIKGSREAIIWINSRIRD
jgi:hypothetical protein